MESRSTYRTPRRRPPGRSLAQRPIATSCLLVLALGVLTGLCAAFSSPAQAYQPQGGVGALFTGLAGTDRCIECHKMDPLFSHAVGIVPTMAVPANLPLEEGRITCITCHTEGSEAHALARQTKMLRETSGGSLCTECHTGDGRDRRSMHALALNRAHLLASSPAGTTSLSIGSRVLDAQSSTCVSCHDGTIASEATGGLSSDALTFNAPGSNGSDHPVGIIYKAGPKPGAAPGEMYLRSLISVDERIRLFDGRVGCGSCHSPYSQEKRLLVMSNTGSRLCLSCHTN